MKDTVKETGDLGVGVSKVHATELANEPSVLYCECCVESVKDTDLTCDTSYDGNKCVNVTVEEISD